MDLILAKKRVLLLVSGGIAIYKSLDLISALKKEGAEIFVVMSEEATRFIAPLTFEAMSGNKVLCRATESFPQISHISYANLADIAIIAPATINTIAKLNYGIADNLIIQTLLACKCAVFIAPSANVNMIESPQNKANLDSLRQMGYKIIPPRRTLLACNVVADGAMAEVSEIIFQLKRGIMGNSVLGMQFRTCENFQASTDLSLVESPKISTNTKAIPQSLPLRFCESQNLDKNQSREAQPLASLGAGVGVVREGEGSDFAIQAPTPSLKENARGKKWDSKADLSAQRRGEIDSTNSQNLQGGLPRRFCESARNDKYLDYSLRECSAQNDKIEVENDNVGEITESALDSADSQNLVKNQSHKSQKDAEFANFWSGKNIVITGGGSVEAIDSIRHISNDSSGKQASYLALAFYYLGASVTLIASKFPLTLPLGVKQIAVKSSADFKNAIETTLQNRDSSPTAQNDEDRGNILLMAAAISDFVPTQKAQGKLKKEQIGEAWDLHLKQNTDILSDIAKRFGKTTFIVGFKAESELDSASGNAKKMLKNKNCDMVVLNVISEANQIGGERNEVRIFTAQDEIKIPQNSKLNISFKIAESIAQNLGKKSQNLGTFSHESQNLAQNPQNLPTKSTQKK